MERGRNFKYERSEADALTISVCKSVLEKMHFEWKREQFFLCILCTYPMLRFPIRVMWIPIRVMDSKLSSVNSNSSNVDSNSSNGDSKSSNGNSNSRKALKCFWKSYRGNMLKSS